MPAACNFPLVHLNGQTFLPSQANNLYAFPAVGLAIDATSATRITDEMFIEATHAVADQVTAEHVGTWRYPQIPVTAGFLSIRRVLAFAVVLYCPT
jgi:malic enzyme